MANKLVKSLSLAILITSAALASAQISFQSGVGTPGGADPSVSFVSNNSNSDFSPFNSSTFSSFSANATQAVILPSLASGWVSSLGGGSTAQWVGISSTAGNSSYGSSTALFAISFDAPSQMNNAVMNLTYSVDDQLGGSNNEGLYLDGVALPGSSSAALWNGGIANVSYNLGTLSSGVHTLYFDDVNSGAGPAGLIFQGTVQSVPEPTPFAVVGVGALGLIRRKLKKS